MNDNLQNLGGRVIRGGMALTMARLINRLFQLIRMLTIARWLGPQEMGVYAVAGLALTTLEAFSETGLRPALIQKQVNISPYLLPVRTVQAVRGLGIGIFVFFLAPIFAKFFHSPDSLNILRVVALVPIANGLEPLFVTLSEKELKFAPIVVLELISSFVALVVGIAIAYFRPDAWALVWAVITAAIIKTVGAHWLAKGQNLGFSFNWHSLKDIRTFGFWIMMTSVVSYIFLKSGDWMIGRLLDVQALALYQMAFLICTTVTSELSSVISALSFPVFSQIQHDRLLLQKVFRQSFGIIAIITLGMAGLVVSCASDFFHLFLGDKWLLALPLIPWLTVWGVCSAFAGAQSGVLKALNKPKIWTITVTTMSLLLATGIYPMTQWLGTLGVAILMAGIGLVMQMIRYWIIGRLLDLSFFRVLRHVLVPAAACVLAVAVTTWIRGNISESGYLIGLIISAVCMIIFYIIFLMFGSPFAEPSRQELIQRIRSMLPNINRIPTSKRI